MAQTKIEESKQMKAFKRQCSPPSQHPYEDLHQRSKSLVENNTGYIGAIHQPIYNIQLYQNVVAPEEKRTSKLELFE